MIINCGKNKILNPNTNKCISNNGKIAKLLENANNYNKKEDYIEYDLINYIKNKKITTINIKSYDILELNFFKDIGKNIIEIDLFNAKLIKNTLKKCIIDYDNIRFTITYNKYKNFVIYTLNSTIITKKNILKIIKADLNISLEKQIADYINTQTENIYIRQNIKQFNKFNQIGKNIISILKNGLLIKNTNKECIIKLNNIRFSITYKQDEKYTIYIITSSFINYKNKYRIINTGFHIDKLLINIEDDIEEQIYNIIKNYKNNRKIKPIGIREEKKYFDKFNELGESIIYNNISDAKLIKNTNKKCIIDYGKIRFTITYKQNNKYTIYLINPSIIKKKICNDKQILNPFSKRCVNKNGIIGKKILIQNEKIYLFWSNQSCFIDSFLVALFHNKNKFFINYPLINYNDDKINNLIISIKKKLIKIYDIISNRKKYNNCNLLRKKINIFYKKLIKYNPKINIIDINENWINSQLDIFDLFDLFEYIFKIPNDLKFKESNNINYSNFIFNIPIDLLINKNKVFIKKIFPSYNIKNNKKIIKTTLLKTDNLFLKIFRNLQTFKLNTKIIPSKTIKLPENSFDLHLNSLIIHYGNYENGHYICLYKSNDYWFEYNDLNKTSVYIGSLKTIIQNDYYTSNIVGLIYSKYV